MTANEKITKGRVALLLHSPFYGILSLKLKVVEVPEDDPNITTAAVDGKNFYYNPKFIDKLNQKQVNFIIVHEVMHCALRHLWRTEHRIPKIFNMACDYAIHSLISQDHNTEIEMLKEDILFDPQYNNMSAEEIYEKLMSDNVQIGGLSTLDNHDIWQKPQNGEGNGNNKSEGEGQGQDGEGNGGFDDDGGNTEKDWETAVINAAQTANAKKAGSVPGYFQRMIDELVNPVKDWRILLREFIEPEPTDYTFVRPDYRIEYDVFNCFLPSFNEEEEKVEDIYFWVDTSGSISDSELNYIYSEVAGAVQQFDRFTGYLGFFDHAAYEPKKFDDFNSLNEIKPMGGGGTSFYAAFEYMQEHNIKPKCVIMLTDGYADFPPEDIVDCPVIWLITTKNIEAPWGRSIYLPLEDRDAA